MSLQTCVTYFLQWNSGRIALVTLLINPGSLEKTWTFLQNYIVLLLAGFTTIST